MGRVPATATLPRLTCRFEAAAPSTTDGVLAVVSHAEASRPPELRAGAPALRIAVPDTLAPARVEVWRTGRPVVSGGRDGLVHSADGHYLFCAARIPHDDGYAAAVERTYLTAIDLIGRLGYPEVARMWNIVGGITAPVPGPAADRYGEFCQARAGAFRARGLKAAKMPAATGIGGHDGHTTVYVLATRAGEIVRIENPRQVPAYEYPDSCCVQPPSFARAAYVRSGDGVGDLFISGTASIVGHETVHVGDPELQTRTTLDNIAELLSAENLRRHGVAAEVTLADLDCVKVYVKRPADVDTVRRTCATVLGPDTQVVYAIADVCREDLLVEIEGFASVRDR